VFKRLELFVNPITHSRSPFIHRRFAQQTQIALSYEAVDAAPESFIAVLSAFAAGGGLGANVTLPLKGLAAAQCAELSDLARRSGVVNTLVKLPGGGWRGENTDGIGLLADLAERHRIDVRGRRTLILGAGGAVAGILDALLDAGVASVVIANRSPARADALVDRIGDPARVHSIYWSDVAEAGAFEFIIDGTAAGQHGEPLALPFSIATRRTLCYDLSYGRAAVDFLSWGRAAGCEHVMDGAGMLVEQAAESFRLWHGVRPDTEPVYQALRAELARS
jgi:shikimate dehydrogenase